MQLRGFRDTIRHARATGPDPRDRGSDDERAAVGVRVEGRQSGLHQVRLGAHVHGEAGVPVGVCGRGEVGEGAEAGVALGRWPSDACRGIDAWRVNGFVCVVVFVVACGTRLRGMTRERRGNG